MQHVHIDQFGVSGLTIRTKNCDETDPKKARINKLWQDFFQACPMTEDEKPVACYGVYSNFTSDENGEFDVTAGVRGKFPSPKSSDISIPAGIFLRFEKKGELPGAVLELWQEVWQYFANKDAPQRLFDCDFEEYPDPSTIVIYIGIMEESNDC